MAVFFCTCGDDGPPTCPSGEQCEQGEVCSPSGDACVLTRQVEEVCDDGNTTGADGCSADCTSDETCGNEVTDVLVGEECDDGNDQAGDGCDECETE